MCMDLLYTVESQNKRLNFPEKGTQLGNYSHLKCRIFFTMANSDCQAELN